MAKPKQCTRKSAPGQRGSEGGIVSDLTAGDPGGIATAELALTHLTSSSRNRTQLAQFLPTGQRGPVAGLPPAL